MADLGKIKGLLLYIFFKRRIIIRRRGILSRFFTPFPLFLIQSARFHNVDRPAPPSDWMRNDMNLSNRRPKNPTNSATLTRD